MFYMVKRLFKKDNMIRRLFKKEDGLGTVEIVIIVAVLVGLALIFRKQIYALVDQLFDRIFGNVGDTTMIPDNSYTIEKSITKK